MSSFFKERHIELSLFFFCFSFILSLNPCSGFIVPSVYFLIFGNEHNFLEESLRIESDRVGIDHLRDLLQNEECFLSVFSLLVNLNVKSSLLFTLEAEEEDFESSSMML